jgi:CheY-like chemotaxis protein/nitrogen-specific signal transduction histidine kinase
MNSNMTNEEKNLEKVNESLRQALAESTLIEQGRQDYISQVTRNVRIPLSTITGMTEIARENLDDHAKVLDCLEKIERAGQEMAKIVNEVTDMAQLNDRVLLINEAPFSMGKLVWHAVSLFVEKARQKNITLRLVSEDVQHEYLTGDYDRIHQLLANIISNAVNFTLDGGKVTVTLKEVRAKGEDYSSYEIAVEDNGVGIPEGFFAKMFRPFQRVDDSRITKEQGAGLGLPIAMRLARTMAGDIMVESEPGLGSRFTVFLQLRHKESELPENIFGDKKFLVISDGREKGAEIAAMLAENGLNAEAFTYDGAYEEKINSACQAIFIDWGMAGDSHGYQIAEDIKKKFGAETPALIMVTNWWESSPNMKFTNDISNIVTRPLSWSKIILVLDRLCRADGKAAKKAAAQALLTGKRVLVAEDNELNAEVTKESLESRGILVEVAENGIKVLDLLLSHDEYYFDCILMDVKMPVMNGYIATQKIRENKRQDLQEIPIVAMTADAYSIDVRCAKNAGMDAYMTKPFKIEEMLKVLEKLCVR